MFSYQRIALLSIQIIQQLIITQLRAHVFERN